MSTTIDAPKAHAGEFDPRGWTVTRHHADWDTDRFAEGPFTVEVEDSYGTRFNVDGIEEMMPWIGDNADIGYVHGAQGFITLGRIVAWKRDAVKGYPAIIIRAGIKKGDPKTGAGGVIDEIWAREIKAHGTMGGWSLGGKSIEKTCDSRGRACYFIRTDILEISWTRSPSNPMAHLTGVSVARDAGVERGEPGELSTVLTGWMQKAYNDYADSLTVGGRLSTYERMGLSGVITGTLVYFENILKESYPELARRKIVVPPTDGATARGVQRAQHRYHSPKMERCLEHLETEGWSDEKAHKICYDSIGEGANREALLELASTYETSIEDAVASYFKRNAAGVDHDAAWFRDRCHHCTGFIALLERAGLSEADALRRLAAALERARTRAGVAKDQEARNVSTGDGTAPPPGAPTGGQPAGAPAGAAGAGAPANAGTPTGNDQVTLKTIADGVARQGKTSEAILSKMAELDGRVASLEGANAQRDAGDGAKCPVCGGDHTKAEHDAKKEEAERAAFLRETEDELKEKKRRKEQEDADRAAAAAKPLTFATQDDILAYVKREGLLGKGTPASTPTPPPSNPNGREAGGIAAQRTGGRRFGVTVRREAQYGETISTAMRKQLDVLRGRKVAAPEGGN